MKRVLCAVKTVVLLPVATGVALVVLLLSFAGSPRAEAQPVICDPVHQPDNGDRRQLGKSNEKKPRPEKQPPVICDCIHLPPPAKPEKPEE